MVTFAITGHVDSAAELKSYDITATARGVDADGANSAFTVSGAASDLKVQANGLAIIAPTRVKLGQRARPDDAALMATAMNYARDEGLKFLNNSENVFYKEASCLRVVTTKPHVKRGETANEEVTVFSRLQQASRVQADAGRNRRCRGHPQGCRNDAAEGRQGQGEDARQAPRHLGRPTRDRRRRAIGRHHRPVSARPRRRDDRLASGAGSLWYSTRPLSTPHPPADSHESGSITYHVHAVVPLAAGSPSAGNGPLALASAPLSWVSVSGQHNKAGLIACSSVDQPYSLVETASALNNGTFRLTRSSSAGDGGPTGLTLRIQMSPTPTDQLRSVFQGACDGFWAPFDRTPTGSSWYHEFLENHLAAVAAGDPCNLIANGPSCSFAIAGWKPGPTGVYAIWQYSRVSVIGCPLPGYNCFISDSRETTTIELRETS